MTTSQTDQDTLRDQVRARYAAAATKVSIGEGDCGCGDGCCGGAATAEEPGFGAELYAALDRDQLPDTAVLASLGCGNPTAVAELHAGETVLDLGSGGGIDVLLSAKRVGPSGKAYGLDMTEEMLALARANAVEAGAPSPDASSTQDMGSLWSTTVESMRESTGFRVRSVANALAATVRRASPATRIITRTITSQHR